MCRLHLPVALVEAVRMLLQHMSVNPSRVLCPVPRSVSMQVAVEWWQVTLHIAGTCR